MQTIKTGVVVALLLAVCYGAFVALNAPDPELPPDIESWVTNLDPQDTPPAFASPENGLAQMDNAQTISPDDLFRDLPPATPAPPKSGTGASEAMPDFDMPMDGAQLPNANSLAERPGVEIPQLPAGPDVDTFPPLGPVGQPGTFKEPGIPGSLASSKKQQGDSSSLIPDDMNSMPPASPPLGRAGEDPQINKTALPAIPNTNVAMHESQVDGRTQSQAPAMKFSMARTKALDLAQNGELAEALRLLSPYFSSPELGYAETSDLADILDALSREVIYSRHHLLAPPYVARPSDTVASVAKKFQITPELLNAINGLGDSKALVPGTSLKVIPGPFHAKVNLSRQELALFVGDMYAGRFPISMGKDPQPKPGVFEVVDRKKDRTYYGPGSVVIPGQDPMNPYGGFWLNLGDEQCIHGTPEMESSDLSDAGCLSLAPLDARDVYNILVVGSEVVISK